MKRLFAYLAAVCLVLSVVPMAFAEETEPEGVISSEAAVAEEPTEETRPENACGDELTWEFKDGTLTITGSGPMDDFSEGAPWEEYKDKIQVVVLSGKVSTVGAGAFTDYDNLIAVDFGTALQEIGTAAFKNCDGLTTISLPDTFRRFGEESFMGCSDLTEIHCDGGMPSFNQNCLWNTWAKIYFPEERPWPLEHIMQLEEAFKGRIEFLASDGSDPYVPTEPTEETEKATEPTETVPPTTVPPTTEAPTEPPVTEQATVPPTSEEPTEAPTEAPVETEPVPETTEVPETEPEMPTEEADLENTARGGFGGLAIISGVMCLLIIGGLVFRRRKF
ncbi:MAG: leucine-rich repeat domain-containing protein [Oscillospiraceae bacterium]|nr:leucine-rich repeat domain-containing protein [Oscillospiraceae bacterium]